MAATNFDLDHTYLRTAVGAPLTEALAQLAVLQPDDPVDFLGNFLLKYVANALEQQQLQERQRQERERLESQAGAGADAAGLEGARQYPAPLGNYGSTKALGIDQSPEQQQQVKELELEDLLAEERRVQDELHSEPSVAWVFQRFLEWLCSALGAEEAYLGRKCVNPEGVNAVHIVASSKHPHSNSVDKFVLEAPADAGDDEDGSAGHALGVTFDVFKEVEPVSTEPEGGPALDADGNPLPPAPPKFIHVENVLREPRVKFFGVPKLGALLTRAGQYKSYLHADVLNESNPEEPNVLEQWLVFSVDTMGQARAFTTSEIECFQRATELFLTTLEEKERALYMKDYERRVATDDPLLREFLVAFAAQVSVQEENLAAQLEALGSGAEGDEVAQQQRAAKEAELRMGFLTTLLVSHVPTLALAAARVVPFKPLVLTTLAAAFELLGYPRLELFNPATSQPSWDKLAPLLQDTMLKPRLEMFAASVTTMTAMTEGGEASAASIRSALPVSETALTNAKTALEEIPKADVAAASPVAACFFQWAQAVIAQVDQLDAAVERARQAEIEAAEAAAAAAEAAEEDA